MLDDRSLFTDCLAVHGGNAEASRCKTNYTSANLNIFWHLSSISN